MRKPRAAISSTWFIIAAGIVIGMIVIGFAMFIRSLQATPSTVPSTVVQTEITVPSKVIDWMMKKSTRLPRSTAQEIAQECFKTKYPIILLALMARESSFNPFVRSKAGAIGLGQIHPKFWADKLKRNGLIREVRDLYDPVVNVRCTHFVFLSCLRKTNNDLPKALQRYVGGKNTAYVKDILLNIGELVILLEQTSLPKLQPKPVVEGKK